MVLRDLTPGRHLLSQLAIETLETCSNSKIETLDQVMKFEPLFGKRNEALVNVRSQPPITYSRLTVDTLERGVKYVQS